MMDKVFLSVGIIVILGSFYLVLNRPAPEKYQSVVINGQAIPVEVADTSEKRTQGLSGRTSLETGHGMLFVFGEPGNYGFWMKDMKFNIDIVWLDENYQVISVEKNVSPDTFPKAFYPGRPAKYVLELNAGEADMLEF